ISDELTRALREMSLGSPTPQAMANMVRRVGSEDLDLIVTAISIQSTVGGNLARILDGISHTIRQRVQMKAQISALTAQMRASGWIITLLPFAVAIIWSLMPAAPSNADVVEGRLRIYETGMALSTADEELQMPFGERVIRPALKRIGKFIEQSMPANARQQLFLKLQLAGRPGGM